MLVHRLARAERSRVTTEEFGTRGGGVVSAEVPCTNPENGTLGRDLHYGYRVFSSLLGLGVGFGGVRSGARFNGRYRAPNPLFTLNGALFTLRGPSLGA